MPFRRNATRKRVQKSKQKRSKKKWVNAYPVKLWKRSFLQRLAREIFAASGRWPHIVPGYGPGIRLISRGAPRAAPPSVNGRAKKDVAC